MSTVFISLGVFVLFLTAVVLLRVRSGNTIDIRSSDIVLALLPVVFWLFLTGKVKEFSFGGLAIEAAINIAVKEPVKDQVQMALPVEAVRTSPKGGTSEIQTAITEKSQALSFTLGRRGYYVGSVIMEYLDRLTQYPYLRYLVLNNQDGTFFGLVDARQLASILRNAPRPPADSASPSPAESIQPYEQRSIGGAEPRLSAKNLADWLNADNKTELATLPGFIAATDALPKSADRKQALQKMNMLEVPTIPVVDESGKFVGTIDRSKLTASILTEIAAKVDKSD